MGKPERIPKSRNQQFQARVPSMQADNSLRSWRLTSGSPEPHPDGPKRLILKQHHALHDFYLNILLSTPILPLLITREGGGH